MNCWNCVSGSFGVKFALEVWVAVQVFFLGVRLVSEGPLYVSCSLHSWHTLSLDAGFSVVSVPFSAQW